MLGGHSSFSVVDLVNAYHRRENQLSDLPR